MHYLVTNYSDPEEQIECQDWEHVEAQLKHLVEEHGVDPSDLRVWKAEPVIILRNVIVCDIKRTNTKE